jgi:DNA primase
MVIRLDDEHQSFSVNRDGSYWNCFAGCGGGTIIDFWIKFKGVELGEAVHELRKMLGVD